MSGFENRTVLISGATGGFGVSLCEKLAGMGANLVLTDLDAGRLEAAAEELENAGARVAIHPGDIADEATSKGAVEAALTAFDHLDVAINNAGIAHRFGPLQMLKSNEAQKQLDVNVMGVFYAMKHQIPAMLETGRDSAIVNVSSIAGLVGAPNMALYVAAKHAVVGLTKAAALENARKGIRINAICPAFARTPIVTSDVLGGAPDAQAAEEKLVRGLPMRRLGEPEEITQAMLWLCDPANSFTTGLALPIDGGISAY